MNNNTKQSEETYIRWSVNMNSAIKVGQIEPEPILMIHPDGRVTTSDRLKPTEAAALVLDQLKTAWLKDAQATKIRELQDRIKWLDEENNELRAEEARLLNTKGELERRIKRMEEMYEGVIGEKPELLGSNVMGLLKRELNDTQRRIKRLEEAGDKIVEAGWSVQDWSGMCVVWAKAKEDKL